MTTSSQQFGTFQPVKSLSKETLAIPFEHKDSVAYKYCNKCGQLVELTQEHVEIVLKMVNSAFSTSISQNDIDPSENYFLSHGCSECTDEAIYLITYERV